MRRTERTPALSVGATTDFKESFVDSPALRALVRNVPFVRLMHRGFPAKFDIALRAGLGQGSDLERTRLFLVGARQRLTTRISSLRGETARSSGT